DRRGVAAPDADQTGRAARLTAHRITGILASTTGASPQTLLCTQGDSGALPSLWIGLTGAENRLTVLISPSAGRSPHHWYGPAFSPCDRFEIHVAIHTGMGPGGILWRGADDSRWSSLIGTSPWGPEKLLWPIALSIGFDQRGPSGRPFRGNDLRVQTYERT